MASITRNRILWLRIKHIKHGGHRKLKTGDILVKYSESALPLHIMTYYVT